MVLLTLIARVIDGLVLVGSVEDDTPVSERERAPSSLKPIVILSPSPLVTRAGAEAVQELGQAAVPQALRDLSDALLPRDKLKLRFPVRAKPTRQLSLLLLFIHLITHRCPLPSLPQLLDRDGSLLPGAVRAQLPEATCVCISGRAAERVPREFPSAVSGILCATSFFSSSPLFLFAFPAPLSCRHSTATRSAKLPGTTPLSSLVRHACLFFPPCMRFWTLEVLTLNHLIDISDTTIQKIKRNYLDARGPPQNTPSSAARNGLHKINDELQDVQRIMAKNIEDVLGRGERLDGESDEL